DHVDDLRRGHLVQRLAQGAVAAVGPVGVQRDVRVLEDAAQEYGFKVGHGISLYHFTSPERQRRGPSLALRAGNHRLNSASSPSTLSGVTLPRPASSSSTAGAPSHTPMHSANSTVTLPSALVSPGRTFSR